MTRAVRLTVALALCAVLHAQSLRELAAKRGIHIGAAANPALLREAPYAETLAREFDQIEPENAMKFGPIQPGAESYNFGPSDALVAFAQAHKMVVRGHTLVWHNQNPRWLTEGKFTPEQLSTILHDHIKNVVGHFAGQVYAWDVVNEAFKDDGTIRGTIWSDSPGIGLAGTAYIEQAIRWAHEADPKALLFYNDYDAEGMNRKSDAIFKMAQDFKARGVPLSGIGLQMHFTSNPPPLESIESNMKRITGLGLQVQITELDVRLPLNNPPLDKQAQIYHGITALCVKFPLCTAIQTWGFTDKYSWIPRQNPGMGAALIFDADYQPKPAYQAIASALK